MDEEDVEKQISESLTKETGAKPDKIDCPGDLKGKVDATMRCTLTAGTEELGLTVTVTELSGTTVRFGIEVDDTTQAPQSDVG